MQPETDPNIVYGGDPEEGTDIDPACPSLGHMMLNDFKLGDSKRAFINGVTDTIWTYRDLLDQTALMARTLYGAGLRANDVISVVCENRHEFPAISYGAICLNAAVAPINVTYTEREIKHAFDLSKPKFVFVSPFGSKRVIAVCKELEYVKQVVIFSDKSNDSYVMPLNDFIKKNEKKDFDVHEYSAKKVDIKETVAVIVCSSGTTGLPKGVLLTQENMMSLVQSYRINYELIKLVYEQQPVVVFSISPWFHAMGFMTMFLASSSRHISFVFLPKYEEEPFLKAIEKYKIQILSVVPPIMVMLAKSPLVDKYDLSSIKDIGCGAAALSGDLEEQVRQRLKGEVIIKQGYGMSETTLGTLQSKDTVKPGSVGEPAQGTYAKIIDESGKSLGPNQRGELCFKGKLIMKGYINDPHATNETIDKDGWLHTGDIAYYDEDKQFYIVDRLKELIKYKAFQVPPAEIEGLLLSNPKIKDSGVVGIPDEESGELPLAFVVRQPGADISEKEVYDFVAEHASKTKWLRGGVKFIDEIPRTPSGKILRRELRDLYLNSKAKL